MLLIIIALSLKVIQRTSALLIGETTNQLKSEQIKSNVGFWGEGKTRVPGGRTSWSKVENQQTQPAYGVETGNQ